MKRIIPILFIITLFTPTWSHAQSDTVFIERPKIALVLSGGGARGAAHIGVIRLIEEMQIPIDIVTGTSMGAIVGGLYAIGYTPDEMDSLLMTQDWGMLLSNGVPRTKQPYTQRKAEQQYQINIPYTKKGRTESTTRYRDAGIKVQKHSLRRFPKVLTRPGLIDGQNLFNLFTRLTIAYHDSTHYSQLPRPYACVATDLVTGEAVVLDKGFLAESMRASMSIPGVFYPVYKENQVLVDGGVINNYPVDVARAMGADIIIGVDLSTYSTTAQSLQTFPSIFERLIGTLGSDLRKRNILSTDILIRPPVSTFPVMGFDTLHLSQLIDIGYQSAMQSRQELEKIQEKLAAYANQPQAISSNGLLNPNRPFTIAEIEAPSEVQILLAQQGISEGDSTTVSALSEAMESIYGLGTFASVQYRLHGNEPYILDVDVTPNPTSQIEMGLRFDSEESAVALLNLGINRQQLVGPKFSFTTRLSINPWFKGHMAYAFRRLPQVNAAIKYWLSDVNRLYERSEHALNFHYISTDIYLSGTPSLTYDLRFGARYDHFRTLSLTTINLPTNAYTYTNKQNEYIGLYGAFSCDMFDTSYLPTSGYAYNVKATYHINTHSRKANNFISLQGDGAIAIPIRNTAVLQPSVHLRWLFGDNIPIAYGNCIGGYLPGRYIEQQIPFPGLLGYTFVQRQLTVLALELRQQLISDLYLSASTNYAHSTAHLKETFHTYGTWGTALGVIYNTTVGPLSVHAHWNDINNRFGAYFSFGYDF